MLVLLQCTIGTKPMETKFCISSRSLYIEEQKAAAVDIRTRPKEPVLDLPENYSHKLLLEVSGTRILIMKLSSRRIEG
jgi:hypothetical protein